MVNYYYYIHSKYTDIEAQKNLIICLRSSVLSVWDRNINWGKSQEPKFLYVYCVFFLSILCLFESHLMSKLKCTKMVKLTKKKKIRASTKHLELFKLLKPREMERINKGSTFIIKYIWKIHTRNIRGFRENLKDKHYTFKCYLPLKRGVFQRIFWTFGGDIK